MIKGSTVIRSVDPSTFRVRGEGGEGGGGGRGGGGGGKEWEGECSAGPQVSS